MGGRTWERIGVIINKEIKLDHWHHAKMNVTTSTKYLLDDNSPLDTGLIVVHAYTSHKGLTVPSSTTQKKYMSISATFDGQGRGEKPKTCQTYKFQKDRIKIQTTFTPKGFQKMFLSLCISVQGFQNDMNRLKNLVTQEGTTDIGGSTWWTFVTSRPRESVTSCLDVRGLDDRGVMQDGIQPWPRVKRTDEGWSPPDWPIYEWQCDWHTWR
jgi:hypothetical protein